MENNELTDAEMEIYSRDALEELVNETIEGMNKLARATGAADAPFAPLTLRGLPAKTRNDLMHGTLRLMRVLFELGELEGRERRR